MKLSKAIGKMFHAHGTYRDARCTLFGGVGLGFDDTIEMRVGVRIGKRNRTQDEVLRGVSISEDGEKYPIRMEYFVVMADASLGEEHVMRELRAPHADLLKAAAVAYEDAMTPMSKHHHRWQEFEAYSDEDGEHSAFRCCWCGATEYERDGAWAPSEEPGQ